MTGRNERTAAPAGSELVSNARVFDRGDLVYLAYLLLPFRVFMLCGRVLGRLELLVRPRSRRAVYENLTDFYGASKSAKDITRLTRQFFEYHEMRVLLLLVAPLMIVRGQLERYFRFTGLQHLDEAIASGRGVMLLGAHINSIGELIAVMWLRQKGYPVGVPMPEARDPWAPTPIRRLVHRLLGATSFAESAGAFHAQFNVRPLLERLRRGQPLLLIGDGWHSASFVDVQFLGRTVPFTTGPLSVARAVGALVLPIFATGVPDRLEIIIEAPFSVAPAREAPSDLRQKTEYYASRVEHYLLANPTCWQHWMEEQAIHTMQTWRNQPLNERYAL